MGSGLAGTYRWIALGAGALLAAAVLLLTAQTPGRAASVPLSISISGNHFVNGAGQTIRLLGVNHASSEYACAQGWGYNDGHQDGADAAAVAAWHANAVRIPLNEDCWLGLNGQPSGTDGSGQALTMTGYRQAIINYVNALNADGIYAILDLHWTAPGAQVALEQQPMPDAEHSPAFWTSVATTFRSNPAVVFDVFNEPYDPTDPRSGTDQSNPQDAITWSCWATGTKPDPVGGGAPPIPCDTMAYDDNDSPTGTRYQIAGMQTLVNSIRDTGARQPIMVGGLNYANDLSGWVADAPNDPLNQEAASFHNYEGQECSTVDCWNSIVAPVAINVPVVTGEFDQGDYLNSTCHEPASTYDSDFMNWADQHGISYLAWGWELLTANEISQQGCSAYFMTSDTSGTPAAPNGTALHDHLLALYTASITPTTTTPTTSTPTDTTETLTVTGVTLKQFKAKVLPGGRVVDFELRASQNCAGSLTGQTVSAYAAKAKRRRPVALGTAHFRLTAGKPKTVALKLSRQARRLLISRHSLKVRITVTLSSGGATGTTRRGVTLKLPPGHKHKS